jgi:hypothetical protein
LDQRGIARRRARGGESIQALRAKRALTAAGALLLLAAVGAWSVLEADLLRIPLTVGGVAALVALGVGLAGRWGPPLQLALSLAVVAYAVSLLDRGEVDQRAPFVAAALLAVGELAYTSVEPPARRVWPFSLGIVAVAAGVGALLLGVAGLGGGEVRDLAIGVVAAAAALAIVARLASRASR